MIGDVCGDVLQIVSRSSLPVDELMQAWSQGLDKFF
jgi:hypothetical protein